MSDHSVLIIDDELPVRESIELALRRQGYRLLFAENGEKGLSLARETTPTTIILDLRMPVMDGLQFLAELNLRPSDPYSVIVLTGHGDGQEVEACYEMGVTSFLRKPFNVSEIRGAVKNGIALKQHAQHLGELVRDRTSELEQEIQERKRVESEVRRINEFNERLIASIPTALAVLRGEERMVVSVNRTFCQAFGLDSASVEGKSITESLALEGLEEVIRETLRAEWPKNQEEMHYTTPNGSERWFMVSATPLCEEAEALLVLIDITEQRQQQEKLQETGRLASIGELAAGVAHEVNNPLTSILGFTHLILLEDVPEPIRDDLEKIRSETERAGKIVQNLLSFARKHEPEQQYMDLTSILERALELKSFDFRNANIQLKRELSPDLPSTMVDEHQLIQVIMNVITNAEQAMNKYQGRGELIVRTSHTVDRIRLSISDDGPGIPQETLPKIFEPFFTTKEVGVGTGLGLSICYGIIQQHGGDIWAESVPGHGTTFHFELPVTSPPEEEREPSTTKHFLVVDDEPNIRDLLARSLTKERYTVDLAENGQEAWRKVQSVSYDLIIMDLKMPEMSGPELFQHIKEYNPELAEKTIFITGDLVSPNTLAFVIDAGNPTLTKPFELEHLRMQIRTSLEATRA
ncbi:MAG: response regulator [Dehalococcoidia bacterium]